MLNFKFLLLPIILLSVNVCFGQQTTSGSVDCSKWISTTEDRMTGEKTTASKEQILISTDGGKTGLGIFWMDLNQGSEYVEYVLSIQVASAEAGSCVDRGSKINILFTDNSKIELMNVHAYNCDAKVIVRFGKYYIDKTHIEQLKTKKIAAMRVSLSRGYLEKDFTSENATMFMSQLNCLTSASIK